MDKEQALKLAKEFKIEVEKRMSVKAVYLFGSFSKDTYRESSDIDVAVVVDRYNEDYFEDTPLLWKLRRRVSNRIEPVLLIEDSDNPLYYDIITTGTRL